MFLLTTLSVCVERGREKRARERESGRERGGEKRREVLADGDGGPFCV